MPDKQTSPAIEQLGECALLVRLGHAISLRANDDVHALADALHHDPPRGLHEIVPAFITLLVTFDPDLLPETALREHIEALLAQPHETRRHNQRTHIVPVRYGGDDGPDLQELAALHGLTPAQAIRLHTERPYRIYFLGFMPGFGYMGRLSPKLATPRLSTPRVRVPAGSVGIAGTQTGVYPFASPGGWRIIGQTSRRVWDPLSIEPTLFSPGDSVQFTHTSDPVEENPPAPVPILPRRTLFQVEGPGVLTTVQDLGRPGYAHSGLCAGGAYDKHAAIRANALLGNDPNAALLEITWTGPTLRVLHSTTIALEGADFGCKVDGVSVPPSMSWFVRGGATISFSKSSPARSGARAYLAVLGGIDVPPVLGSRSTYLPAALGGYMGRALWAGDQLQVGPHAYSQSEVAGRLWLGKSEVSLTPVATLRFTRFRGAGSLPNRAIQTLTTKQWQVSGHSDRMGTRLNGENGHGINTGSKEMVSFGVVRGAIQLPPDGNPVLLGVDHQTTGGYPLLGVIAQADFPLLAQLRPGDWLRFTEITIEQARLALAKSNHELQRGLNVLTAMT